ncbi:MAG: peptidase M23 [Gemmatimonadetes bacterium]|nr:MAG: peptidase M23 [Gemmatimonadota bacterium]
MGQRISVLAALLLIVPARQQAQQPLAPVDWKQVDAGLGKSGALQPDGAYKVGMPRSDLHVTVGGVAVKPPLALGSWVAFKQVSDTETMLMGDLVLLESEVGPVLGKLQEGGIEQTALHNHVLHESPRVMYMHIGGHGAPARLAAAIHAALALTTTPFGAPGAAPAGSLGIDSAQIGQILGYHGKVNGGVYQVGVPRAEKITADGIDVPTSMGLATAINFQPTGGGKTAITGDFVLIGNEVNPVIRALRDNGIAITALHSHMLTDSPHLFFMHYWANDDALKLAHGLRAALDKMNIKKAG